jgi:hypothetical protein
VPHPQVPDGIAVIGWDEEALAYRGRLLSDFELNYRKLA